MGVFWEAFPASGCTGWHGEISYQRMDLIIVEIADLGARIRN